MTREFIAGKSILVTGAGSGFGKLTSQKAAALGANLTCVDIDPDAAKAVVAGIRSSGGAATGCAADVSNIDDMRGAVKAAVDAYGAIDVIVNNAGIMPLAFLSDHEAALAAWDRCIDINFKGVVNGTVAAYDQMIAQGRGHIINLSSIFGDRPVAGAAIYGATKAAVNYFSHAVRQESSGKIKVTVIKPTGVPATGLAASVVNPAAGAGILGQNAARFWQIASEIAEHPDTHEAADAAHIAYAALAPDYIADAIIYAIAQPWGVAISDMTVRAAGDVFVL